MYNSAPACHNQTTKSSKFRTKFQIIALRALLNKALQALKETTDADGCEKTFFYRTNFHRFHVYLFDLFLLN